MSGIRNPKFGDRIASRLNLFRKQRNHSGSRIADSEIVTGEFLRKLDRLTLSVGRDLVSGLMGEHSAVRRTAGIEFADYRRYTPGDDIRRVDWNAYARLGTLHIRQAQAEHDTRLHILVDASFSMDFGSPTKFHAARRLAAALGYIALAHLDSVTLATPGSGYVRKFASSSTGDRKQSTDESTDLSSKIESLPLRVANGPKSTHFRGRAESANLFRYLQDLSVGEAADFSEALSEWGAGHAQGRIAVVISDFLLDGYQEGLRQMVGTGFSVTLLHLLSDEELHPPDAGDMEFVDSETGHELQVHLGHESLAEYHRRLQAWLADIEQWSHSSGINYIRIQSDWDIERILLETLKRHGVTA